MNEGVDVKDQTDAAIAQNCGSSEKRIGLEGVTETLDDDFLFADEFVYEHAALDAIRFNNDGDGACGIGLIARDRQVFVEAEEWEDAAADFDKLAFAVNGGKHFARGTE